MTSIPKNNLAERMLRIGYDPNIVKIQKPVLDNSKIIKTQNIKSQPDTKYTHNNYTSNKPTEQKSAVLSDFRPPEILNLDEWSDFEDE